MLDLFNQTSHFTRVRKHIFKETVKHPEYVTASKFYKALEETGFVVVSCRGSDFKPCQGYLF